MPVAVGDAGGVDARGGVDERDRGPGQCALALVHDGALYTGPVVLGGNRTGESEQGGGTRKRPNPLRHDSPPRRGNYRCTRPLPSPAASRETSSTDTRLKSPGIVCLRAPAATAKRSASAGALP